jgi:alpha-mannosidase
MMIRFAKSRQLAEFMIDESLKGITERIDTSVLANLIEDAIPFTVFNTTGWQRTGVVSVELDVERIRFDGRNPSDAFAELQQLSLGNGVLIDQEGKRIPFAIEDLGVRFCYELPDHGFRQRFMARKVKLTFEAAEVPALGYKTYAWSMISERNGQTQGSLVVRERTMENDWVKVDVADNGSLTLTDKSSGRSYTDLCIYEDVGDIGNEYIFRQPDEDMAVTTADLRAQINVVEHTAFRAVIEIVHQWEVPTGADDVHYAEIERMVPVLRRKGRRAQEKIPFEIITRITLEKSARCVTIAASFDNRARDHRLRVLLPTDLPAESHFADSVFEIAERDNHPADEWTNPSYCQHQQAFVGLRSTDAGLTVANAGLNEYEVLRDGRNTIAITLLRSVAELGDWGVFPTPEAQCLGRQEVHFAIIPHAGDTDAERAYSEAYQFQVPWTIRQAGTHGGDLPAAHSFIQWSGAALALSAVKISEDSNDLILRWFNMTGESEPLTLSVPRQANKIYRSNVMEERLNEIPAEHREEIRVEVNTHEILTLALPLHGTREGNEWRIN